MFERKNQNILSEHYQKLVDHGLDADDGSDDEFITLKRADHDLDPATDDIDDGYVSKRKAKMALSKKALGRYGEKGHKLVFDDAGEAHEVYEMKSTADVFRDERAVFEAGRQFAETERGKLKEADVLDKAVAKEKKREKKRKRKEREHEVCCFASQILGSVLITFAPRARDTMAAMRKLVPRARMWQSSPTMMDTSRPSSISHQTRMGRWVRMCDLP